MRCLYKVTGGYAGRGGTQTLASSCRPVRISASRRGIAERGGGFRDRGVGLAAAVAEVDQRRDGVVGGAAETSQRWPGVGAPIGPGSSVSRSLSSLAMRPARRGPTPLARPSAALSWAATARASSSGPSTDRTESATLAPTPCTVWSRRNQAALGGGPKAVERDALGADLGLDQQIDRLARARQGGERAGRARHQIADPADVDHRVVLVEPIEGAAQARDHRQP